MPESVSYYDFKGFLRKGIKMKKMLSVLCAVSCLFLSGCTQMLSKNIPVVEGDNPLERKINAQKLKVSQFEIRMNAALRDAERHGTNRYSEYRHMMQRARALESKWQEAKRDLKMLKSEQEQASTKVNIQLKSDT
jgi:hypothetical protein